MTFDNNNNNDVQHKISMQVFIFTFFINTKFNNAKKKARTILYFLSYTSISFKTLGYSGYYGCWGLTYSQRSVVGLLSNTSVDPTYHLACHEFITNNIFSLNQLTAKNTKILDIYSFLFYADRKKVDCILSSCDVRVSE